MVFSWRTTTFRTCSSVLSSLSWFKTWSIWRWTWSSISTWINATRQIARVTENIADENCEGWETWGVFDFSMNRLVCYTAVFRVVTQTINRWSDYENGCYNVNDFSSIAAWVVVAYSVYDSGNVLCRVSDLISSDLVSPYYIGYFPNN